MKNIQFWHMQMFPGENWREFSKNIPMILQHYNIIGMADWETDQKGQIEDFCYRMNVNDIVAIKDGKQLIALVQVIGGEYSVPEKGDNSELDWIVHRRPVRVLDWAVDNKEIPQPRGTLSICSKDDAETTKVIKEWFEKVKCFFEQHSIPLYV